MHIWLLQKKLFPKTVDGGEVMAKPKLGRGLGSLIEDTAINEDDSVKLLRITQIEPNKNQPRHKFDDDKIEELSESIKEHGIIQPIIVVKSNNMYKIVAGERRWRAAKKAGIKEIPVIIRDYSEQEIVEIALIENIQREDLNPIEEALAFQRLINDYKLKQDEVAEKVSKSRVTVTNSLRLLKLDKRVQEMLISEMITAGHARTLLGIEDGDKQYMVAMKIFDEKLSVREIEKLIKNIVNGETEKNETKKPENDFIFRDYEEKLNTALGSKVTIKNKDKNKGKIEINYTSIEEFERIVEIINKGR